MKVVNHFKNVTNEEKLVIYYYIIKILNKGEKESESTVCETVVGQKR